jgi:putative DNA primase/helicase
MNSLATVALAGEMATEYGITGWDIGAVISSIATVFGQLKNTDNSPSIEHTAVLNAVRAFIEEHGESRFIHLVNGETDPHSNYRASNSAGYVTVYKGKKSYLFHMTGIKNVLTNYELKPSIAILEKEGWLLRTKGENLQHKTPDGRKRLFTIQLPEDK